MKISAATSPMAINFLNLSIRNDTQKKPVVNLVLTRTKKNIYTLSSLNFHGALRNITICSFLSDLQVFHGLNNAFFIF